MNTAVIKSVTTRKARTAVYVGMAFLFSLTARHVKVSEGSELMVYGLVLDLFTGIETF